ncbi:MAG: aspartate aminotransferase family protein [Candidatus Hodarchaeota archaeon]
MKDNELINTINQILRTDDTEKLIEWDKNFAFVPHAHLPIVVKRVDGIRLIDTSENEYLDFLAGATCTNIGYGNRDVINSIIKQLESTAGLMGIPMNVPSIKLIKLLAEMAPRGLTRSFTICGGSEANEQAIKIARRYTKRSKIISLWGGYHGNTAATLSASGVLNYKMDFDPNMPGFIHVPPPYCYRCDFGLKYPKCGVMCAKFIEHMIHYEDSQQVAAVIAEPIIGWGGVVIPPKEYFPMIRQICDKYNILLIIDEVLTGFGRTGKLFACEHWDLIPDIMTIAKGLTSFYIPCSAVLIQEKIAKSLGAAGTFTEKYWRRGVMGITSMNHPAACAAALANIKVILEKNLPENSKVVGEYFLKNLGDIAKDYDFFGEIRGKGLLIGLEVVKDKETKEPDISKCNRIQAMSVSNGLIIGTSMMRTRNSSILLFSPPLITSKDDVDRGLEIFQDAINQIQ